MNAPRRTIVVVGGLAAGPSAASKAARTDPGARVLLFEESDAVSYGICELPYFVAGEVPEAVCHQGDSVQGSRSAVLEDNGPSMVRDDVTAVMH